VQSRNLFTENAACVRTATRLMSTDEFKRHQNVIVNCTKGITQ